MLPVPPRSLEKEMLDGPLPDRQALASNLRDLAWVNRWAGGSAAMTGALSGLLGSSRPEKVTILDVATGGADIPLTLVQWGRRRGIEVQVEAIDLREEVVEIAREFTAHEPAVRVSQGDALSMDTPDGSFDFVISSLTLHHLSPEEAVRFLSSAYRICRRGLIMNDLDRSWLAWAATTLVARTLFSSFEARHDGPLSVLRAYRSDELKRLAEEAKLDRFRVESRFPFRLLLTARK